MTSNLQIGQMIEIGKGTSWGGIFRIIEIRRTFANGKTEVVVDFNGKPKVFNV